jgi:diguanylate cyclase (GGDEF)-like protein
MLGPRGSCVNIPHVNLEMALWQWSNAVQITSLMMIVAFFAVLRRSVRRAEMRWWVYAWSANLLAIAVALGFWYLRSRSGAGEVSAAWRVLARVFYVGPKTFFLLMLLRGTWTLRGRTMWLLEPPYTAIVLSVLTIGGCLLLSSVDLVGIGETTAIAIALGAAAATLGPGSGSGFQWLRVGFATRALLAVLECVGYTVNVAPHWQLPFDLRAHVGMFLAVHSSFDIGAEWLIALGCVFATLDRTQRELQAANTELLATQADLRRLADRDPLTGLSNRRALAEIFRAVQPGGATLVFFDLNGFKQVNDEHGHHAGDDCLKRFADALVACFRPQDAVVRYAGDEFVVVASGLSDESVRQRVDTLRTRLRSGTRDRIAIAFSYGLADLPPGGHPETALRAADEAMYRVKGLATIQS